MDYCAGGEFFRMLKSQRERRIPEEVISAILSSAWTVSALVMAPIPPVCSLPADANKAAPAPNRLSNGRARAGWNQRSRVPRRPRLERVQSPRRPARRLLQRRPRRVVHAFSALVVMRVTVLHHVRRSLSISGIP